MNIANVLGTKRRKKSSGEAKVGVVMGEFKKGMLKSGSGRLVRKRSQAIAIALSEAGLNKGRKNNASI